MVLGPSGRTLQGEPFSAGSASSAVGLVRCAKARKEHPSLEDRMLKVCRVLEHLSPDEKDLTAQLAGIRRFAAFCYGGSAA